MPIGNLTVNNKGTQVTFCWTTKTPVVGSVHYGSGLYLNGSASETAATTNHVVTVTGLTPNTRLWYSLGFADSFNGHIRYTAPDVINTGVVAGHQILRLKTAALIYMDANDGVGFTQRRTPPWPRSSRTTSTWPSSTTSTATSAYTWT